MLSSQELIIKLGLKKHPVENGYMSGITYQSSRTVSVDDDSDGKHEVALADTVYFLYEKGQYSPWHRMRSSDELWIHQAGGVLKIYMIDTESSGSGIRMERLEPCGLVKIPAGCWFAAQVDESSEFCLSTVLLCPGFDIKDFQLADPNFLESILKNETDREIAKQFINKA